MTPATARCAVILPDLLSTHQILVDAGAVHVAPGDLNAETFAAAGEYPREQLAFGRASGAGERQGRFLFGRGELLRFPMRPKAVGSFYVPDSPHP